MAMETRRGVCTGHSGVFDNALRTVEMSQMGFLLGQSWRGGMLQQLQVGCEDAVWSLQERSELGKPWGLLGLYFWKLGAWK